MPAVMERNADPRDALARVGRSIEAFQKDVECLAAQKVELTERYPNEWVAVFEGAVVAHSRQSRELLRQLRAKDLVHRSPVIQFLSTKPMTLIL